MDGSGPSAPRRRPADGGYARGEETRDRIIEAAMVVFAEEGYAGASTRRIAARAGVNPPALQYYFDGKDGLHRACAQFIIDHVAQTLGPALRQADAVLSRGGRAPAVDALCDLMDGLAELSIAKADASSWSRFMARCQADDAGPAFPMTQEEISTPIKNAVTALTAAALGRSKDEETVRLRAVLILSQLSAFHVHRDSTLKAMGWAHFEGEHPQTIKAVLRANTRAMLQNTD